jgi:hypothetical protein
VFALFFDRKGKKPVVKLLSTMNIDLEAKSKKRPINSTTEFFKNNKLNEKMELKFEQIKLTGMVPSKDLAFKFPDIPKMFDGSSQPNDMKPAHFLDSYNVSIYFHPRK